MPAPQPHYETPILFGLNLQASCSDGRPVGLSEMYVAMHSNIPVGGNPVV